MIMEDKMLHLTQIYSFMRMSQNRAYLERGMFDTSDKWRLPWKSEIQERQMHPSLRWMPWWENKRTMHENIHITWGNGARSDQMAISNSLWPSRTRLHPERQGGDAELTDRSGRVGVVSGSEGTRRHEALAREIEDQQLLQHLLHALWVGRHRDGGRIRLGDC